MASIFLGLNVLRVETFAVWSLALVVDTPGVNFSGHIVYASWTIWNNLDRSQSITGTYYLYRYISVDMNLAV